MSCTLMYQPYAMSYSSSSCERTTSSERQKLFKFPHVPSPPDSSNSAGGSSHSPSSTGTYAQSHATSHPSVPSGSGGGGQGSSSSNFTLPLIPPTGSLSGGPGPFPYHSHPHHHPHLSLSHHQAHQTQSQAGAQLPLSPHEASPNSQRSSSSSHSSRRSLTPCATVTSGSEQGQRGQQQHNQHEPSRPSDLDLPHTITSGSGHHQQQSQHHHSHSHTPSAAQGSSHTQSSSTGSGHHHQHHQHQAAATRAQYLTANCVVYENYEGDTAREVDEHFSKALSVAYSSTGNGSGSVDKSCGKSVPMSTRNFPPSFWNSAYQPPVVASTSRGGLGGYGHSDFYGSAAAAMDYPGGLPVPGLHHQSDPWHYSLTPHHHHHHHHQSYHHHHRAAADLAAAAAYTPMPSTSRFNPAQYSSFLFPSTAAASAAASASRFGSSVGVKGDGGHWGAGGRYHPHESSWSDFHLADYSAAAAHYSNITAAGGNF